MPRTIPTLKGNDAFRDTGAPAFGYIAIYGQALPGGTLALQLAGIYGQALAGTGAQAGRYLWAGTDWNDTEKYKKFIADLLKSSLKMKKFPLCIKESGGNFERGKDKTEFGEKLSESNDENSAVYTIKLNDIVVNMIRKLEF